MITELFLHLQQEIIAHQKASAGCGYDCPPALLYRAKCLPVCPVYQPTAPELGGLQSTQAP